MGKMGRSWIVPLLVFALLLSGCAHQPPVDRTETAAPPKEASQEEEMSDTLRRFSQPTWTEKLSTATEATGATVTGAVVLVVGGVLIGAIFVGALLAKGGFSGGKW
jgi:hypothetical protein